MTIFAFRDPWVGPYFFRLIYVTLTTDLRHAECKSYYPERSILHLMQLRGQTRNTMRVDRPKRLALKAVDYVKSKSKVVAKRLRWPLAQDCRQLSLVIYSIKQELVYLCAALYLPSGPGGFMLNFDHQLQILKEKIVVDHGGRWSLDSNSTNNYKAKGSVMSITE